MKDTMIPEPITDEREEDQDNDRSRRMDPEKPKNRGLIEYGEPIAS